MDNPYQAPQSPADPDVQANDAESVAVDPDDEKAVKDAAGRAVMLSLVGLFCFGPLALFAISEGRTALKLIAGTGAGAQYKSNAVGGIIVGWVTVALWGILMIVRFAGALSNN